MSDYESVLRVFWDADSLFRLASTKLPEEQSATLTILRLTVLKPLVSVTSVDVILSAAEEAKYLVLLTHNTHHFLRAERIWVLTPREFLERLRRALLKGFQVT